MQRGGSGIAGVVCAILGLALGLSLLLAARPLAAHLHLWVRGGGPLWLIGAMLVGAGLYRLGWPPARLLTALPQRWFVAAAAALALASGIWAHHRIHKAVPDVPDEFGYLHQARSFADGALAAPSPPASEFHYVSWGTHDNGRWYAVFPPGYGLLLAAGVKLDAAGLVNPVLGALLVLLLFDLARLVAGGDRVGARLAVLVYLASWFRLMHAGSFMAHPTAALWTALAVLGVWRGVLAGSPVAGRPWWAAAGGIGFALLCATRPLGGPIAAVALAPAVLYALRRDRGLALRRLGIAAACAAPLFAAYLGYNRALTGAALVPPQQRYMALKERRADCFRLGFGPGVGECPITQNTDFGPAGFRPRHAVANTRKRLVAWTRYGFAWAPLALLPALGLLLGWRAHRAAARRRALCGGLILGTVLGYGLFFYHGVAYGARFYYEAFPFAAILAGVAVADIGSWLGRRGRRASMLAAALGAGHVSLLASGLWLTWPEVHEHAGRRQRTSDGAALALLSQPALADALVFVNSMVIPAAMTRHPGEIARNHPIVVADQGDAANAGFARLYPDRRPARLEGLHLRWLTYAADAPLRHEGAALYPLQRFAGGFGDGLRRMDGVSLSRGEALRFRLDGAAHFAVPVWALAQDAGAMILHLALVHHPGGPEIDLRIDRQLVATAVPTRAAAPTLVEHTFPVSLSPGQHWLTLRMPRGRAGQILYLDYVELRRRGALPADPAPR